MSDKVVTEPADEEANESSGLPGAAGALVNVANSKPFTALFGPAFGVLGEYWGERMQEWVKSKRAKNINAHVERVKTIEHIDGEIKEPSERQAAAILDWAEEAQKIDPEREDDLAALWQGILGRIYNDDDTEELVALLKQMNRGDARALLDLPSSWFPREALDPIRAGRFQRLGLISEFDWRQAIRRSLPTILMLLTLALFLGSILPLFLSVELDGGEDRRMAELLSALSGPLAIIVPLAAATVFLAPLLGRVRNVRLSSLGLQLRDSGRPFYRTNSPR